MLPFKYRVEGATGETLNVIARKHDLSVDDLRHWNPQILPSAANSEYFIIPNGTIVQLPPMLHYRGNVYGSSFRVGDFAERLHDTLSLQNELLKGLLLSTSTAGTSSSNGQNDITSTPQQLLFTPPRRKVLTKQEAAQSATAAEAVRTIPPNPRLQQVLGTSGTASATYARTEGLSNAAFLSRAVEGVDLTTLGTTVAAIDSEHYAKCPRECLQPHNASLMAAVPAKRKPNHLSDDRVQTTPDLSRGSAALIDRCRDVRLSLAFYDLRTLYTVKEVWAVLASQPLGALIDALRCKTMLLSYHTTSNSFFFIGGTFYIDDRREGYKDLTEELRQWDPVKSVVKSLGRDAIDSNILAIQARGYGACPVKKVSETTFGDLRMRLNELCVFRHCGNCDHVFYLADCGVVPKTEMVHHFGGDTSDFVSHEAYRKPLAFVRQFPRRTYMGPERTINCDVCAKLPASIATYGDAIAPFNPALFCLPCFRISHCDRDGNEVNDGYVKLELPDGEFF